MVFKSFFFSRLSKPQRKRKSAASSSSADITNHSGGANSWRSNNGSVGGVFSPRIIPGK